MAAQNPEELAPIHPVDAVVKENNLICSNQSPWKMAGQARRQPPGYLVIPPLTRAPELYQAAWFPGIDPDYERRQEWQIEGNSIDLCEK